MCVSRASPQNGMEKRVTKSRKQSKERKNRSKKVRGVKKTKIADKKAK